MFLLKDTETLVTK